MIYLLDTNILIAYLREPNPIQQLVDKKFAPLNETNEATVSIVTVGEIKAIAIKNGWGKRRISKTDETLKKLIVADINAENILTAYAEIDAFSQGRLDSRVSNFTARNMGKNDIWIAATAAVLDATLLTTDSDFDHLNNKFLAVAKIDLIV
ncbi:MAG: type II toxin-antitoxin system VapC family toxin [Pyrinomonadaceae bacterium]